MRTLTTAERGYVSGRHICFAFLEVTNAPTATNPDGSWVNVGDLTADGEDGLDFFNTTTVANSRDQNTLSFSATMQREIRNISLVPFRAGPVNVDDDGAEAPLLDLHREWRIYVAIMPEGIVPDISDYRELAKGVVDLIAITGDAQDGTITITGRGLEADILDAWVTGRRTYSDDLEAVIQDALDDQFGQDVHALVAAPTSFHVDVTIGDTNLMPVLADSAALKGDALRYEYDASDVLSLQLIDPDRDNTTPDFTIGGDEYERIDITIDRSGTRNFIVIDYPDEDFGDSRVVSPAAETGTLSCTAGVGTFSASQAGVITAGARIVVDRSADGSGDYVAFRVLTFNGTTGCTLEGGPTFGAREWHTSASITKYGLLTYALDLTQKEAITTQAQAGGLADTIRSDLEDPDLEQSFRSRALWFVQLDDIVATLANGVHYTEDQQGAVTSYTHEFANGDMDTTVGLSGKPKGRYALWRKMGTDTPRTAFVPAITQYSADYWERYTLGVLSSGGVADFGTVNARTRSLVIDVGTDPTFALLDFSDPKDVTPSSNFTHEWEGASRAQIYYFRATPYSGPLDGGGNPTGVAGAPAYAQTYIDALRPTQAAHDALVDDVDDLQDYVDAGLAAQQAYTDAKVAGLSWKHQVRAATTVAGTLATSFENGDTIDGVTLATGDRILIKDQASPSENGIYVVAASGAPTRATDADSGAELVNASCYVSEGTTNADTQWTCSTNAPITLGSTSLAFAQLATGTVGVQTANTVYAGPTAGGAALPTFRALTAADIPSLDAAKITSGVFNIARIATGTPDGTKFVRDDGTLATPSAGTLAWHVELDRSLSGTVDDTIELGSWNISTGLHRISLRWLQTNAAGAKDYIISTSYTPVGVWQLCKPITFSLTNTSDLELEVKVDTASVAFRLRRTVTGLVGAMAVSASIEYSGSGITSAPTFTPSSTTSTSAVTAIYAGRLLPSGLAQAGAADGDYLAWDDTAKVWKKLSPPTSAGGSLAGTYPNPTIASSVSLPGSPTTTTQSAGDNSTKVATTAYVDAAVAAGGGGGGGAPTAKYTIWDPLIPDVSPDALTDEFTSNTIGSYTTVYGNGDSTTVVDIHGTRLGAAYFDAPSIQYHQHSLLKALPAGDFAIFTAVRIAGSGADATLAGIILATASTAGSGATMANVVSRGSAGGGVQVSQTLAWNGFGSSASGAAGASASYFEAPLVILRIRRVGTTVTRAHSSDGTTWMGEVAVTNAAWTHFGIFFQNYSGTRAAGSFEFLRYYSSGSQLTTGASRTVFG